jgi:pimeloyl-ACP methyl ester carboxylesterase
MRVMKLPVGVMDWRDDGRYIEHGGHKVFVFDTNSHPGPVVVILHGFPSSSFDWHLVVPELAKKVRVVALDFLGYGLSDKPDVAYSLFDQADLAQAVAADCNVEQCVLVSHDMGDTVAAELMKRQSEGNLPFRVERSILFNGSIFIDMAELSAGQQFLLALPDERLADPLDIDGMRPGLEETFSKDSPPDPSEIDAMVALLRLQGGDQLLPRLIRYIEERRANQDRWTSGLVDFDGPMTAMWGEQDPIAVVDMTDRLKELRPQTEVVRWPDLSHWPSIEDPKRVAEAILERI